tara:strand:- start:618 stop:956 length:339 start_codon:yes stop_codon:yes gene_type:complete
MMGPAGAPVQAKLIEVFKSKTQAEWTALLDEVDCCVEPVLDVPEALKDGAVDAAVEEVEGTSVLLTDVGARPRADQDLTVAQLGADARQIFSDLEVSEDLIRVAAESGALPG